MRMLMTLLLLGMLVCVPAFGQPVENPYAGHRVVRVHPKDAAELESALGNSVTVLNCTYGVGPLDLQVTDEQIAALRGIGFDPVVLVPDLQAVVNAERAQIEAVRAQADASWFETFRTLDEINARLDYYSATYPNLCSTFSIGQSLEGREIRGIRFTGPDQPGNLRVHRRAALFNACQHAREWATPMAAMWIADRFLEAYGSDGALTDVVNSVEVIVIPVVNPDGYLYSWQPNQRFWRKNKRTTDQYVHGVDLNRNFGYEWGGAGASPHIYEDTYRGTAAFSEPEASALRDFVLATPNIGAHLDIHSYGQLVLSPWGYTPNAGSERGLFVMLDQSVARAITGVHGMEHRPGPLYTSLYPASGVIIDWMFGARGIPSLTLEVRGPGFAVPATEIIPIAQETFAGVLRLCEHAKRELRRIEVLSTDMEQPAGWTVGAPSDTAIFGVWTRSIPVGTVGSPTADHTPPPGQYCWVTGAAGGGTADLDGGATTLTTSAFSMLPPPRFRTTTAGVHVWIVSVGSANDSPVVSASNDNGLTWTTVLEVTARSGSWREIWVPIDPSVVHHTATMKLRFVAQDLPPDSTVDCAIDDLKVVLFGWSVDPDVNCDMALDGFDIETLGKALAGDLTDFCAPDTDFNADGNFDWIDLLELEVAIGGG